jgi:hypothetical protein
MSNAGWLHLINDHVVDIINTMQQQQVRVKMLSEIQAALKDTICQGSPIQGS